MAQSRVKLIQPEQSAFIKFEIENGSDRRIKAALQQLCWCCRNSCFPDPQFRYSLEITIAGKVLASDDPKVIRWCLNSLAQIGTLDGSGNYVEAAFKRNEGNPEIVAAAVTALSKIYNGALNDVPILKSVDPIIRTLAALQNTDPSKLDLRTVKIDIDTADEEVLKLALITVGLNRDIENLFHPKHSNGEIVKALGQHPDDVVRQYCVWSVIENSKLDLQHLGIPFDQLGNQPDNVQSKLLQLAAERIDSPKDKHGVLEQGTHLPSILAREGLAKGMRRCFYDGVEDIVIPWFDVERQKNVKLVLTEHIAKYSNHSEPYENKALEIAEIDRDYQTRVLLGAEGKPLYGRVKAGSLVEGMSDLFPDEGYGVVSALKDMANNQHVRSTMKVLILSASPSDAGRLRLDKEAAQTKEQLSLVKHPAVELDLTNEWAVRYNQIQGHILNTKPDILHFSGHGDTDFLCFENELGDTFPINGGDFAELIRLNPEIECVLLNCCYSDSIARLVAPHVKAVIGCDDSVADEAAIAFSRAFYRALASGRSYKEAFELAKNEISLSNMTKEAQLYQITMGGS